MFHARTLFNLAIGMCLISTTALGQQKTEGKPKKAPKGQSEGIKVHGHWTVEVRNPDGKLVTHREFENSLVPASSAAFGGGAYVLGLLFLGDNPPQGFQMVLSAATSAQNPCLSGQASVPCTINENIPASGPNQPSCPQGSQSVFCSLTRSLPLGSTQGETSTLPLTLTPPISFQGSFTAAQTGSVGNVALNVNLCQSLTSTSPNLLGQVMTSPIWARMSEYDCAMGNYDNTTGSVTLYPFTATTLSSPVQVLAGQIVSAAVVISFQ